MRWGGEGGFQGRLHLCRKVCGILVYVLGGLHEKKKGGGGDRENDCRFYRQIHVRREDS